MSKFYGTVELLSIDTQSQDYKLLLQHMNRLVFQLYINSQSLFSKLDDFKELLKNVENSAKNLTHDQINDELKLFLLHGDKILEYGKYIQNSIHTKREQKIFQLLKELRDEVNSYFNYKIDQQKFISLFMFIFTLAIYISLIYFFLQDEKLKASLKLLNDELKCKNMELQNRNEELLEAINKQKTQEKMLIQQSKMAAMGEMIGVIAHQWKQPLNALSLQLDILVDLKELDELSDEEFENAMKLSRQQIDYMRNTITDFRNFFKPKNEKDCFNVFKSIQNVVDMLKPQFKKYSIDVKVESCDDIFVELSENEFKQVILNILTNAKDAIEDRKKRKEIGLADGKVEIFVSSDDEYVYINIKDNGGGIPKDIIDTIFNPYVSTKGENGTGIGLYMAKMIIEDKNDGSIEVKNIEDGAMFIIRVKKGVLS